MSYPPVNKHSWLENPPSWIGNTSSTGGFSIAMLDYRCVHVFTPDNHPKGPASSGESPKIGAYPSQSWTNGTHQTKMAPCFKKGDAVFLEVNPSIFRSQAVKLGEGTLRFLSKECEFFTVVWFHVSSECTHVSGTTASSFSTHSCYFSLPIPEYTWTVWTPTRALLTALYAGTEVIILALHNLYCMPG